MGLKPTCLVVVTASISFFNVNSWAQAEILIQGDYRYIRSDGIPNHQTGQFPNQNNPNTISAQNYVFKVPVNPRYSGSATPMHGYLFGVALNGIPFDPGTAEFWNNDPSSGWNYEALGGFTNLGLDMNNAHVQPSGAYHYHGIPMGIAGYGTSGPQLIGYAADGFPIYGEMGYSDPDELGSPIKVLKSSYMLKGGNRNGGPGGAYDGRFVQDYTYVKGQGDLDQCNGRFGKLPDYPEGTYYYVLTSGFPFVPRCFMGQPDSSFMKRDVHGHGHRRSLDQQSPRQHQPELRREPRGFQPPAERDDSVERQLFDDYENSSNQFDHDFQDRQQPGFHDRPPPPPRGAPPPQNEMQPQEFEAPPPRQRGRSNRDRFGQNPQQGFGQPKGHPPQDFEQHRGHPPQDFDQHRGHPPQGSDQQGGHPPQGFDQQRGHPQHPPHHGYGQQGTHPPPPPRHGYGQQGGQSHQGPPPPSPNEYDEDYDY